MSEREQLLIDLRAQSRQLADQIHELEHQRKAIRSQLSDACPHEVAIEVEYVAETMTMHTQHPYRVCVCCGIEEEGWGSGYKQLRGAMIVGKPLNRNNEDDHKIVRRMRSLQPHFFPLVKSVEPV